MTDRMRKMITAVLAVIFVCSTVLMIRHSFDAAEGEKSYEAAAEIAGRPQETPPEQTVELSHEEPEPVLPAEPIPAEPRMEWIPVPVEEDEYMEKLKDINLQALRETNPQVVGWVFIPDCKINYPIVRGTDNQHYLKHTWDNRKSTSGAIFMEATNQPDFSDFRTIIYGHNMADRSMFGSLYRYDSETNWKLYPYVYLVTDQGVLRYEVYSSYRADVESGTYVLGLDEEDDRAAFINLTREEAIFETGIVPATTDRLLTLSTCVGNASVRRVVHARLPMVQVEIKTDSPQAGTLQ